MSISGLIEQHAATRPHAIAVSCPGHQGGPVSLSYRELDLAAGRLAAHLAGLGVGHGDRVVTALRPGPESVTALLAVLRTGAAYVPADPAHSAGHREFVVRDSTARAVLARVADAPGYDGLNAVIVCPDDPRQAAAIAAGTGGRPHFVPGPDDVAYVSYASCAAGEPGGAADVVRHGTLLGLAEAAVARAGLTAEDVVAQVAGPAGEAYALEVWSALAAGAQLVCLTGRLPAEPDRFERVAVGHGVTVTRPVGVARAGLERIAHVPAAVTVPRASAAGRVWPRADDAAVTEYAGHAANTSHPAHAEHVAHTPQAENSAHAGQHRQAADAAHAVNGGHCAQATHVQHATYAEQAVRAGHAGHTTGPDAETSTDAGTSTDTSTSTSTATDTDTSTSTSTGTDTDTSTSTSTGTDTGTGTGTSTGLDAGAARIEVLLNAHPAVGAAGVSARGSGPERRLVAQVVPAVSTRPADGTPVAERSEVYESLRIDIPRTDLEAVLRTYLKERLPRQEEPLTLVILDAPPPGGANGAEGTAASSAAGAEGRNGTPPGTPVQEPGTPVQEMVRDLFAELLGLPRRAVDADGDFFRLGGAAPEWGRLLERLRETFGADPGGEALGRAATPAGLAALLGDRPAEATGPGGAGTQSAVLPFRLRGTLDVRALEAALADLGRRHEALRNSRLGTAGTRLRALAGNEHLLELALPAVDVDQWSQLPLAAELALAYEAHVHGREPVWARPVAGPAPRALWGDRTPTALPPGGSPLAGDPAPGHLELDLDGELHARLTRFAAGHGATLFMVAHTALAALLTRLGAGPQVTLAAPVPARYGPAARGGVGPYGRVLALSVDTGGDPSFAELLRRVRTADLGAFRDPGAPLALPGGVALSVLQEATGAFPAGRLTIHPDRPQLPLPTAELGIVLTERQTPRGEPAGLTLTAAFPHDTVGEAAAASLVGQLVSLLKAVLEDPDRPVGRLRLTPGEAAEGAGVWAGTRPVLPEATVAELVVARAAGQPRSLALGEMTYAELDARSDLLAHALIEHQAGPGTSVLTAIASPAGFAVAALAVAKTGAACVPVDPVLDEVPDRLRPVVLLLDEGADRVLRAVPGAVRLVRAPDADLLPVGGRWPVEDADRTARAATGDPVVLAPAEDGPVTVGGGAVAAWAVPGVDVEQDALWLVGDYPDANDTLGLLAALAGGAHVRLPGSAGADPRELVGLLRDKGGALVLGPVDGTFLALARSEGITVTTGGGWAEGRIVVRHTPEGEVPAPGFGAYVLDARLRPVAPGHVGALYVAGAGVAQGYTGAPAATGERFLPDPFGGPDGSTAVMWRTGRAALVDADGALHVLDEPPADDPFADEFATFLVVTDARGHSALWPAAVPVPEGWRTTHAEDLYELCIDHLKNGG